MDMVQRDKKIIRKTPRSILVRVISNLRDIPRGRLPTGLIREDFKYSARGVRNRIKIFVSCGVGVEKSWQSVVRRRSLPRNLDPAIFYHRIVPLRKSLYSDAVITP